MSYTREVEDELDEGHGGQDAALILWGYLLDRPNYCRKIVPVFCLKEASEL